MKKVLILIASLLTAYMVKGQVTEIGTLPADTGVAAQKPVAVSQQPKKLDWGVQLGTSATFAGTETAARRIWLISPNRSISGKSEVWR